MIELKWDGSYLGKFSRKIIGKKIRLKVEKSEPFKSGTSKSRTSHKPVIITILKSKLFCGSGVLKCSKSPTIPCLLDQLKECFGLRPLGIHQLNIGGKKYVWYKCLIDDLYLHTLTKLEKTRLKPQMQELVAYRFLMCIPKTTNSSFIVRNKNEGNKNVRNKNKGRAGDRYDPDVEHSQVYSIVESSTTIDTINKTIEPSETFIKEWFDEDFHDSLKSFFPVHSVNAIPEFKDKLDAIIHRIDSDYAWLSHFISEFLLKYMSLNEKS